MTHQLLISLDSFFPSPSLTQAISFNTIIFLSMFYQVFIICIIQPDQEANLSSYHFFYQETASDPTNSNHLNPSAFFIMVGSEAPSIYNLVSPISLFTYFLYFPDNSSHCLTHIFYFTSPSTTHQQK
jgi:hypothetical protein